MNWRYDTVCRTTPRSSAGGTILYMGKHRTVELPCDNGTTQHCRADGGIRPTGKPRTHALCFFAVSMTGQIMTSFRMSSQSECYDILAAYVAPDCTQA